MSGNVVNNVLAPMQMAGQNNTARKDASVITRNSNTDTPELTDTSRYESANAMKSSSVTGRNDDSKVTQSSLQEVETALDDMSKYVKSIGRNLQFSVDEDLGRTVIKVVDSESDEVIRQIPAEELLEIAKSVQELLESKDSAAGNEGFLLKTQA